MIFASQKSSSSLYLNGVTCDEDETGNGSDSNIRPKGKLDIKKVKTFPLEVNVSQTHLFN